MEKLFGTDGIRGRAYEYPLDEETVRRLGVALERDLKEGSDTPRILLAGMWTIQFTTWGGTATIKLIGPDRSSCRISGTILVKIPWHQFSC